MDGASSQYIVAVADPPVNKAVATIKDVNIPVFSISDASAITAGANAEFTITSNIESTQPHTIMVKATNAQGSSFLDTDQYANDTAESVENVMFTSTQPYTYTLNIPTKDYENSSTGEISVELIMNSTDNTYNVQTGQNTATVQVLGELTLAIARTVPHVIEGVNELAFTVTSNVNPGDQPISVSYTVTEDTTDFLADSIKSIQQPSAVLNFDRTNATSPWTANIVIPLRDETDGNSGIGSITVELITPTTNPVYKVAASPNHEAEVTTYDRSLIPTLAIEDAEIVEGINGDESMLEFDVTLSDDPISQLAINYQVVTYQGNAIRAIRGSDFKFTPGQLNFIPETPLTQNISVIVLDDNKLESDEEFLIEISAPENALVIIEDSIGVGKIIDNEEEPGPAKPFVYVEALKTEIDEGASAVFFIRADRPEGHTSPIRDIGLSITQITQKNAEDDESQTADFIGWRVPRQITIPANEDEYRISIATVDDNEVEKPGEITATLTRGDDYNLNIEDAQDTITVNDNDEDAEPIDRNQPRISVADVAVNTILEQLPNLLSSPVETQPAAVPNLPTISVVALSTNINEGEKAEFNIIASSNLTSNLVASFAIHQSGDFLSKRYLLRYRYLA